MAVLVNGAFVRGDLPIQVPVPISAYDVGVADKRDAPVWVILRR